jgi:hypothetical protein
VTDVSDLLADVDVVDPYPLWQSLLDGGPVVAPDGAFALLSSPDCTPGYYNNEGRDAGLRAKLQVGYPAGASAYFAHLAQWRDAGTFAGLAFR